MKTREDVYKAALTAGKSKEDALKEAEAFAQQQSAEYDGKFGAAEKSLGSSKTKFQEAIELAKSVGTVEVELDVEGSKKKLSKSLETDADGNVEDIGKFLAESQNIQIGLMKGLQGIVEKVNALAKSVETIASGLVENDHDAYLVNSVDQLRDNVETQRKGLVTLTKGLSKSQGFSTRNLLSANVEDFNTDAGEKKLTKSQTMEVLDKLVEDGKVSEIEAMGFEGTGIFTNDNTEKLVMEKAKEMNLLK